MVGCGSIGCQKLLLDTGAISDDAEDVMLGGRRSYIRPTLNQNHHILQRPAHTLRKVACHYYGMLV